jgi:hypothetical protein
MEGSRPMEQVEVSAADIARIAGVRPSAVSNWRRRHHDFPEPVSGTDRSPKFDLAEIEAWLRRQGKAAEIPPEERVWQAFESVRGVMPAVDALVSAGILLSYLHTHPGIPIPQDPQALKSLIEKAQHSLVFDGKGIAAGLMDLLRPFDLGAREVTMLHAVAEAAADDDPAQTFEYLCSRFLDTGSRGGLAATPPELAELMLDLAESSSDRLFDPACGSGAILLAAAKRGYARVEGQELNASLALVSALRLALADTPAFDVHPGDSLRQDAYPRASADAVVCNPPFGDRNWGQEELADDSRWEYELPSRLESELAWVQHALAHGGTVVMLMPPAAAARPSGRRIRANLLRRGTLRAVISLPPRLAAHYALALQIWVLQRPIEQQTPSHLLLVDASGFTVGQTRQGTGPAEAAPTWAEVRALINQAWTAFCDDPRSVGALSEVALAASVIGLLDDEVDLTPGKHLPASQPARVSLDELAERHAQLAGMLAQLAELLPELPNRDARQSEAIREVTLEELAETGAIFIRRTVTRPANDKEEHANPRIQGRILTSRDMARATPPSEVAEVIADELRNPAIHEGDVLVPLIGRRLIARVATGGDVGAYLSSTVFLIRPDTATIDPWFLAGFLSSSEGGRQAARMTSTLGEHIRFDPRRVRIPLLPIATQRAYGEAFRKFWEFARTLRAAHDLGIDFVRDLIDVTAAPLGETADREESPLSVRANH